MNNEEIITSAPELMAPATEEKMLPQSQVNEIVARAKREAAERAMQQMQMQQAQQAPQMQSSYAPQEMQQQQNSNVDMQRMIDERISQQAQAAREQYEREMLQRQAQQMADEFFNKLEAGKSKYDDFDTVVEVGELSNYPDIVKLAHSVDNTADVIYDLMKNPSKLGSLTLLGQRSGKLAQAEIRRLSESIKNNEQALKTPMPREPLSSIRPSRASTDSGQMSIRDLRKQPWMKG